jgi:hypothetical protein
VSRDELTEQARAELAALDGILAREHVDEEHLELAALVDSVRADAPRMDDAFRSRLEQTLARRPRRPLRAPRDLALGGCVLAAAAVALSIVISSGLLGSGGTSKPSGAAHARSGAIETPRIKRSATGTSFAGATHGAAGSASTPALAPAPARLVHHSSSLVLTTPAASLQHVANAVISDTEAQRGVVASSNVSLAGTASTASFSLRVPTPRLAPLISALTSLAGVRSFSQQTNDITLRYDRETSLLTRERAEKTRLLAQIAAATTSAEATMLRHQLGGLEQRIAVRRHLIAVAQSSAATAHLAVNVLAVAPRRHRSGAAGAIGGAFGTALRELSALLAIALVVLAIVLPVGLTTLALWWAATLVRQRARERALRAA